MAEEDRKGTRPSRRRILQAGLGATGLAAVKAVFPNISAAATPTAGPKNVETRIAGAKSTGTAVAREDELHQIEERTKKLQQGSKATTDVAGAVKATLTAAANEDARIKKAVDARLTVVAADEKKVQDRVRATQVAINNSNATATGVANRAGIEKSVFATRVADKLTATAQAEPTKIPVSGIPAPATQPTTTPGPGLVEAAAVGAALLGATGGVTAVARRSDRFRNFFADKIPASVRTRIPNIVKRFFGGGAPPAAPAAPAPGPGP